MKEYLQESTTMRFCPFLLRMEGTFWENFLDLVYLTKSESISKAAAMHTRVSRNVASRRREKISPLFGTEPQRLPLKTVQAIDPMPTGRQKTQRHQRTVVVSMRPS
jgi:hypothetical protein